MGKECKVFLSRLIENFQVQLYGASQVCYPNRPEFELRTEALGGLGRLVQNLKSRQLGIKIEYLCRVQYKIGLRLGH
jgi:hypothetical protein